MLVDAWQILVLLVLSILHACCIRMTFSSFSVENELKIFLFLGVVEGAYALEVGDNLSYYTIPIHFDFLVC